MCTKTVQKGALGISQLECNRGRETQTPPKWAGFMHSVLLRPTSYWSCWMQLINTNTAAIFDIARAVADGAASYVSNGVAGRHGIAGAVADAAFPTNACFACTSVKAGRIRIARPIADAAFPLRSHIQTGPLAIAGGIADAALPKGSSTKAGNLCVARSVADAALPIRGSNSQAGVVAIAGGVADGAASPIISRLPTCRVAIAGEVADGATSLIVSSGMACLLAIARAVADGAASLYGSSGIACLRAIARADADACAVSEPEARLDHIAGVSLDDDILGIVPQLVRLEAAVGVPFWWNRYTPTGRGIDLWGIRRTHLWQESGNERQGCHCEQPTERV